MNRFLKISTIVASVALSGANAADIMMNDFNQFSLYFDTIDDSAILKQAYKTDNIYLHKNPAFYAKPITNSDGVIIGYDRPFSRVKIHANKIILDNYTLNTTTNGTPYEGSSCLGTYGDQIGVKTLSFDLITTQGVELSGDSTISVNTPSIINGNLSSQGSQKITFDKYHQGEYTFLNAKIPYVEILSDSKYQGDLYIDGNLTMTNWDTNIIR